ncbi:DUF63 family protein [Natronorarus salvus]|uniref:DUF63 family protein n=1 Tax=Natronorarus salvus TaxID=3117733 RepID=UPI002F262D52
MVLPEGFALPPPAYLLPLALATVLVCGLLFTRRPTVGEATVVAFAPWMAAGAGLHVLYVTDLAPPVFSPLLGTPAVYVSTFALAGAIWLVASEIFSDRERTDRVLGATGLLAALAAVSTVLGAGLGGLDPFWPAVAAIGSVALTAATWVAVRRGLPMVAETTGLVGLLVVFGHVLDGVSTAVGVDLLGAGERSPIPLAIMEFAEGLAPALGGGWLFVLVKLALAVGLTWLFVDYVEEAPAEGYLLLGLVAAVGLGPGVHNLLLFTLGW